MDADPDFHVDADPDPDPDWPQSQNNGDPYADPTPSFTHVLTLLVPVLPIYSVLSFSSVSNVSYVFITLDSVLNFLVIICLELIPIRFAINWMLPGADLDPTK